MSTTGTAITLKSNIPKLVNELQGRILAEGLRDAAAIVVGKAQDEVPVLTGNLKRSITFAPTVPAPGTTEAFAGVPDGDSVGVEGSAPASQYAGPVEKRTGFMSRAAHQSEAEVKSTLEDAIRRVAASAATL